MGSIFDLVDFSSVHTEPTEGRRQETLPKAEIVSNYAFEENFCKEMSKRNHRSILDILWDAVA